MPEARLQRTRDAYAPASQLLGVAIRFVRHFDPESVKHPTASDAVSLLLWRAMHENAAEQLKRGMTANVIEGDLH